MATRLVAEIWAGSYFFLIFKILFIYFWLCWVFITARGLSLVVASGESSRVAMHVLLIVLACLVVEDGL